MKKLLCVLSATIIMVATALPVFAAGINANEKEILDMIRAGVTVNETTYYLPISYVNQAETYLSSSVDLTDAQADEIAGYINQAKAIIKADGATSFEGLTSQTKQALLLLGQKAAAVVGLKLTVTNGLNVTITDANGNIVFQGDAIVKTTGAESNATNAIVLSTAMLAAIGLAGFGVYKAKSSKA